MNFPDAVATLLRRRKLVFWNTAAFTILAVIVSLLLPHRYTATARILPPPDDDPLGLAAQLTSIATGQLSRLRAGIMGGGTASDLMVGVLSSNTVMESVAAQCSIVPRYRVKGGSVQEAVRLLEKMTRLSVGDEGIVSISVEASRPEWAAEMANSYVSNLDAFLRTSNISRGRNMRVFVEGRLEEVGRELDSARAMLTSYQAEHGLAAVDDQLRGIMTSYSDLYGAYLQKQTQLRLAEATSSPENPLLAGLRTDVAAYRRQLRSLLVGTGRDHTGGAFGISFDTLPAVVAEYLRRLGELTLLQEAYSMLYQQFEQARIMEARDAPTITVLDHAVPPERRSFPKRVVIVLIVFAFSLTMSMCYVLGGEALRRRRELQSEADDAWRRLDEQLNQVLEAVRRFFRRHKPRER